MTSTTSAPDHEPPPSRPGKKSLIFGLIAVAGLLAIYNWSEISEIAHLPEIQQALGFG